MKASGRMVNLMAKALNVGVNMVLILEIAISLLTLSRTHTPRLAVY